MRIGGFDRERKGELQTDRRRHQRDRLGLGRRARHALQGERAVAACQPLHETDHLRGRDDGQEFRGNVCGDIGLGERGASIVHGGEEPRELLAERGLRQRVQGCRLGLRRRKAGSVCREPAGGYGADSGQGSRISARRDSW